MRQAGLLTNRDLAQRFADFLLTQRITAKVDADGESWAIWIREEDQLPQARRELQEFIANPESPRYLQAGQTAQSLRRQQARDDESRRKNMIEMRDRWAVPLGGHSPLTFLLIAVCIVVALATQFGERDNALLQSLWFQPEPANWLDRLNWTPTKLIDQGEVWRIVTPIFIHLSPWHLFFDTYCLYIFGSMIEARRGSWRFGLLVLLLAITSNWAQYYFEFRTSLASATPTTFFGGMSGVCYGLFGYLSMKSRFDPQSNLHIPINTIVILMVWFVLCWTGMLGSIANWAHTAGLVVGAAIGYAPVAWRKLFRL